MNKPFYILAPMDDVTDTVFRRVVTDCSAPDLTMTEFVNVDGLCSPGRAKLMPRLNSLQDTTPVIAQIWGKKPENFEQIAREIADGTIKGFSGIDLNFGCPDKAVIKNECCSAMQQPELRGKALELIRAAKKGAGDMPVSIKTRLGFDSVDYGWHELLLREQPSMLTVHVRTTKQMSKVPADWDAILPIIELRDKISPETKIVLNGDIENRKMGDEIARKLNVDGIMIGRGVFHDPYCFSPDAPELWANLSRESKIELFKKHLKIYAETYSEDERKFNPLKKFAKIYIANFNGAAELREKIMNTRNIEDALAAVEA